MVWIGILSPDIDDERKKKPQTESKGESSASNVQLLDLSDFIPLTLVQFLGGVCSLQNFSVTHANCTVL
jgi:hypothetical protein